MGNVKIEGGEYEHRWLQEKICTSVVLGEFGVGEDCFFSSLSYVLCFTSSVAAKLEWDRSDGQLKSDGR